MSEFNWRGKWCYRVSDGAILGKLIRWGWNRYGYERLDFHLLRFSNSNYISKKQAMDALEKALTPKDSPHA